MFSNANMNESFSESFELMRKKQNAIQEKQKNISHKQKENLDPDISKFLEDSRNNKMLLIKCNQSEECLISSTPYSTRHSSCMQTSAFRELLPHALMSRSHEKSFETKSLNHSHMSMVISTFIASFRHKVTLHVLAISLFLYSCI